MKKIVTLPNLYVFLWALYYTQGTFLTRGSIWSRGVLFLYLLISLYFVILTYTKYHTNLYLKALGVLLIMFTFYGVVGMAGGVSFDYLKLIYLSLLPTYAFFVWTKKGQVSNQWIQVIFWVLVGVIIVQYLYSVQIIEEKYSETDNSVVNVGYEVLALIPLLYFWRRKPFVQYLLLALVLAVVLSTVKRGAILIGAISILFFFYSSARLSSKKMRWYTWLLIIVFMVVGIRYAINFFENNTFAQMRIEATLEGDSSGRDYIYSKAWSIFINSNVFCFLFGHGAWETLRMMSILAHNDWLEILVNQGLLGGMVYLFYWFAFYKTYRKDTNMFTRSIMGTVMIIYFLASLFSMSYAAMTLPANIALGFSLAGADSYPIYKR